MSGGTLGARQCGTRPARLTITGNLAFQSGAIYLVQVNPTTAAFDQCQRAPRRSAAPPSTRCSPTAATSAKHYTILTATGGVAGHVQLRSSTLNLPSNFTDTLSYDANNAYLNLALSFVRRPAASTSTSRMSATR